MAVFKSYLAGAQAKQAKQAGEQAGQIRGMQMEDILSDRRRTEAQEARKGRLTGLRRDYLSGQGDPQAQAEIKRQIFAESPQEAQMLSEFTDAADAQRADTFGQHSMELSFDVGQPTEQQGLTRWADAQIAAGRTPENVQKIMERYAQIPDPAQKTQFLQGIVDRDLKQSEYGREYLKFSKDIAPDVAKPKDEWITIPGIGAVNIVTKERIGPEQMAQAGIGEGADVGTIQAPVDIVGTLAPKVQEKVMPALIKKGYDRVVTYQEDATKARNLANDLERFKSLLNIQETGGILRVPGATSLATMFGDEEIAEMASISDKLTPAMRQGMPGAASDRDVAMFKSATVGPEKPSDVNRKIADAGIRAAGVQEDKADFMDFYRQNVDSSLTGAESEWRKYLNANPIFDFGDPEVKTSYKLNDTRVPWQNFFEIGGAQAAPVTAPQAPAGLPPLPPGAVLVE